jgi:hypothetical protein
MRKYLAPDADIIENPLFESGVIKIQRGLPLTDEEAVACSRLQKKQTKKPGENGSIWDTPEEMTVMQRLEANRKKRKVSNVAACVDYVDVSKLICATSNCCERLFSEAKYIIVPHRRGMSPIVFESLIFLKKNVAFWTIKTVARAMKRADNDEKNGDELFQRDDDQYYE